MRRPEPAGAHPRTRRRVTYRGLRIYAMASKTVDIKLQFPQYLCQPGREEFDKFERNLYAHGGISDNEGWSLADCLMRTDDGAVDAMGNPMPGVVPIPAAGGDVLTDEARGVNPC